VRKPRKPVFKSFKLSGLSPRALALYAFVAVVYVPLAALWVTSADGRMLSPPFASNRALEVTLNLIIAVVFGITAVVLIQRKEKEVKSDPVPDSLVVTDEQEALESLEAPVARTARVWQGLSLALTLLVLWRFIPVRDVLRDTTITGGDIAGHVWFPYEMKNLLPHLSGWSDDWYAGFPAGALYFPLPALLTTLFAVVLPQTIAMKLTVALAACLLPFGAWFFTSALRIHKAAPAAAAAATLGFQVDRFHTIYGGNLASVFAGMFSLSLGFALALFAAGLMARYLSDDSKKPSMLIPVVIAASGMSHLLAGMFLAIMTVALLVSYPNRTKHVKALAGHLVLALGLAAVWWMPFLASSSWATDMGYEPTRSWNWLFPPSLKNPTGPVWWFYVVAPLALASAIWGFASLRRGVIAITVSAMMFAGMYALWPTTYVWDARWLPYWWWCLWMLAGIGVVQVMHLLVPRMEWIARAAALLVFVPALAASGVISHLPGSPTPSGQTPVAASWAHWDFTGYESKTRWVEYRAIIQTMADLSKKDGCGRALWEYDQSQGDYGSPMAMMLLPYWTNGCVDSMEGLFMEGSQTTPFHFLIQRAVSQAGSGPVRDLPYPGYKLDWGVPAMRTMGVRWFMTYNQKTTDEAQTRSDLVRVASSAHWAVFEIKDYSVAAPFSATKRLDDSTWPRHWADQFIKDASGSFTTPHAVLPDTSKMSAPQITNITSSELGVSFDTSQVGYPVMVRQSFYPGWEVEGATGPYRAGPNMMVVVPTSKHVVLTPPRPVMRLQGEVVSIAAISAYGLYLLRRYRRRSSSIESLDPEQSVS
jgi:hypothetical protein